MDDINVKKVLGHEFLAENHTDRAAEKLLDFLIQKDLLTSVKKQITLAEYSVTKEPIGVILIRNGFITHSNFIDSVIEYNPDSIINEQTISSHIDYELLINYSLMIIAETKDKIYLSTLSREDIVRYKIKKIFPNKKIIFLPAIVEKIDKYIDRIKQMAYSDSSFLERLLKDALKAEASDIHIIPKYDSYSIFFRIIGVKRLIHEGELEEYYSLVARIKDRSKMDLAEKRIPQDGGFQIENNSKFIDMRVATIPTATTNEQVVIRLLDPDRIQPSLDLLGITRIDQWRKGVSRPDGIALICGPTGSGKTTTLQASIREMDRFGKAIYTVEDPVEYRIPFVGQVNINKTVGLDFPATIKAFMRADPDIMMIGEIRDEETARIAIKGAETGHLVVGTLHTSSIRNTIDRLRDIGVSAKELRYILRSVLVQRLIRTICDDCKGKGCGHCHGEGYVGRTVVSECQYFRDEHDFDKIINNEIDWPLIIDDAIQKVQDGVSTPEEIIRVFGEEGERKLAEKGIYYVNK